MLLKAFKAMPDMIPQLVPDTEYQGKLDVKHEQIHNRMDKEYIVGLGWSLKPDQMNDVANEVAMRKSSQFIEICPEAAETLNDQNCTTNVKTNNHCFSNRMLNTNYKYI